MLKIIGLIFVSSAVSFGGILMSESIREGTRQRSALLNLLYFIKSNIALGSLPLHEIYCRFEDKTLEEIGFIREMRKHTPDSLYRAFENTKGIKLTEKEKADYFSFASQIGRTGSVENEETLCLRYIEILGKVAESENSKDENRAKLFRRLGPVLGLFLAVILI